MMRRHWPPLNRYVLTALSVGLIAGAMALRAAMVLAAPVCQNDRTHGDGTACPSGQVCVGGTANGECTTLAISLDNPTSTESTMSVEISSNSLVVGNFYTSNCLGTTAVCGAPPATGWTAGYSTTGTRTVTPAGQYHAGRGITFSFAGGTTAATMNGSVVQRTLFTNPGYAPAAATVTATVPGAATFRWTTDTGSDTRVRYSTSAPFWGTEAPGLAALEYINHVTALPTDIAWATTTNGRILARSASHVWTAQYTDGFGRGLTAVDAATPTTVWAVGMNGVTQPAAVVKFNGTTWNSVTPSVAIVGRLFAVVAPNPTTVFLGGDQSKIYRQMSGVWSDVTPPSAPLGAAISYLASADGKVVWAVTTTGTLFRSMDAGASWTTPTLPPGSAGLQLNSVATLDNQTVWVGASGGKVWRSTNGLSTTPVFTLYQSPDTSDIRNIELVRPDEAYTVQGTHLLHFPAGGGFVPTSSDFSGVTSGPLDSVMAPVPTDLVVTSGAQSFSYRLNDLGPINTPGSVTDHSVTLSGLPAAPRIYYAAESVSAGYSTGVYGSFVPAAPDTIAPGLIIDQPNNLVTNQCQTGSTDGHCSFRLTGSMSDNAALTSLTCAESLFEPPVELGGLSTPPLPIFGPPNPAATWYDQVWLTTQGPHNYSCTVTDGTNSTTAQVNIIYDYTPPTLQLTTDPLDPTIYTLPTTIDGTVSDTNGIRQFWYILNGTRHDLPVPTAADWHISLNTPEVRSGLPNEYEVHATDPAGNESVVSGSFEYVAPTFNVTVTPNTPRTAPIGTTLTYTVNVVPVNGFANPVSFSTNIVGGMSGNFSPASLTAPYAGGTTMTVDTSGGIASATPYTLTITGTSGTTTATVSVQITLQTAPNYSISAAANYPMPSDVHPGDSGSFNINLSANNSLTGTVNLSITGMPSGMTATFVPTSVALVPNETDTATRLNIVTTSALAAGTYPLVMTSSTPGVPGLAPKTTTITIIVSLLPGLELTPDQVSQSVIAGGSNTLYSMKLKSISGYGGAAGTSVSLTYQAASGDPLYAPYIDVKFDNTSATKNVIIHGDEELTIYFGAQALSPLPGGTYQILITAQGTTATDSAPVSLVVSPDVTPPTISAISANANWDYVTITWQTNEFTDGSVIIWKPDNSWTGGGGDGVCSSTPCQHTVTVNGLDASTLYYFSVTSRDTAPTRNATTATTAGDGRTLQFTTLSAPDTTRPIVVEVSNPADSATPTLVIGAIDITGRATDNNAVAGVDVVILQEAGSKRYTLHQDCSGAECAFGVNWLTDDTVPNGLYTITVTATDQAANTSNPVTRRVDLENNWENPEISTGPTVEVAPTCAASGECWAKITWTTNQDATTEIRYDTVITCDPALPDCTYRLGPIYDDAALRDPNYLTRTHSVTLTNLESNAIYHYHLRSCNGNRLCVY